MASPTTPSYAVLGATGNTGQALIKVLLKETPRKAINAYCRSKQKLFRLSPEVQENKSVSIFEGSLDDIDNLANCLRGTRAAFLTVALSDNVPGCTIAIDTAKSVVSALEQLQKQYPNESLPRLVVLSSASLDDYMSSELPKFVHKMLFCAAYHVYTDLQVAEKYLRSKESLTTTAFVRPGGLSHDTQKGHVLSPGPSKTPLSFLDLAAGMIEVADRGDEYAMKGLTVNPTAKDVAFPRDAPLGLLRGLLFYFMPWTYKYLK